MQCDGLYDCCNYYNASAMTLPCLETCPPPFVLDEEFNCYNDGSTSAPRSTSTPMPTASNSRSTSAPKSTSTPTPTASNSESTSAPRSTSTPMPTASNSGSTSAPSNNGNTRDLWISTGALVNG